MTGLSPMRFTHLTFDAVDKHALAQFWSDLLEWDVDTVRGEVVVHSSGDESNIVLVFMNVPEEKRGKNRCHPDIETDNLELAVQRAERLGAVPLASHQEDSNWVVLQDPEGNEFCLIEYA